MTDETLPEPDAWYMVVRGEKMNPLHGPPTDYSVEHCKRDGHQIVLLYTAATLRQAVKRAMRAAKLELLQDMHRILQKHMTAAGLSAIEIAVASLEDENE